VNEMKGESRRILVVSDSHGNHVRLQRIIDEVGDFDFLVHCGDGAPDLIHVTVPAGVPVVKVAGNVDLMRPVDLDRLSEFTFSGKKILVVHGDMFGVQNGFKSILREGVSRGAEVIFFGHTHIQFTGEKRPLLFNPGAANRGSYGIVEIDQGGRLHCSHYSVA